MSEVHIKGDCVHKDKAVMAEVVAKRRVDWYRMCGILTINLLIIAVRTEPIGQGLRCNWHACAAWCLVC